MTDDSLIKQCQSGDEQAFETLLDHYYEKMHGIAFRWCQDSASAQDITQNACLKLAKSIDQFKFQSSFESWLFRLVVNCAKDFYKSPNQYSVPLQAEQETEAGGSHTDESVRRIYARQIMEHIGLLRDDLREALVLVYGSGLNHQQAASQLGVQESTVSWRIHEARKLLKDKFSSPQLHGDDASETTRSLL